MTPEEEKYVIKLFKENYKGFPDGTCSHPNKPDFVIQTSEGTLGIEVSEVFQDSADNDGGSSLKQREGTQGKFGNALVAALTPYFKDKTFSVGVNFNNGEQLGVRHIHTVVKECMVECLNFLLNAENGDYIRIYNDGRTKWPLQINSIYIHVWNMGRSFYDGGQAGTVSDLTLEHIQKTLIKHEDAMDDYILCDEYWLIIREGNYYAGSFDDVSITVPIETKFDKVFILRTPSGKIISLKH